MTLNAELNVEGMSCDHCKDTVEKSLTSLDGVNSVKIDLAEEKVTVNYDDSKTNLVDIKQAIMEKGFAVMEI